MIYYGSTPKSGRAGWGAATQRTCKKPEKTSKKGINKRYFPKCSRICSRDRRPRRSAMHSYDYKWYRNCLPCSSFRHPELVEGSHWNAKVTFVKKRFFDSATATLRMTKAREIVRTRMDSVGFAKKAKGYRSLFLKHLIRHFVTPSPTGEGKNARKTERKKMDSEGLYVWLRTVEDAGPYGP